MKTYETCPSAPEYKRCAECHATQISVVENRIPRVIEEFGHHQPWCGNPSYQFERPAPVPDHLNLDDEDESIMRGIGGGAGY